MQRSTSTAVAAVLATVIATAGFAPTALAQERTAEAGPGGPRQQMILRHGGKRHGMQRHHIRGGEHGGGLLHLACSDRGQDRMEHMLLSLEQRVDPTAEQRPLFDALSQAVLDAQADFAETCAGLRPEAGTADATTIVERFANRIELDSARIAALREVLPALQAFHDSLTDEQKALLEPRRGQRMGRHMPGSGSPVEPSDSSAPDAAG